jgi:hypothetical protein
VPNLFWSLRNETMALSWREPGPVRAMKDSIPGKDGTSGNLESITYRSSTGVKRSTPTSSTKNLALT